MGDEKNPEAGEYAFFFVSGEMMDFSSRDDVVVVVVVIIEIARVRGDAFSIKRVDGFSRFFSFSGDELGCMKIIFSGFLFYMCVREREREKNCACILNFDRVGSFLVFNLLKVSVFV